MFRLWEPILRTTVDCGQQKQCSTNYFRTHRQRNSASHQRTVPEKVVEGVHHNSWMCLTPGRCPNRQYCRTRAIIRKFLQTTHIRTMFLPVIKNRHYDLFLSRVFRKMNRTRLFVIRWCKSDQPFSSDLPCSIDNGCHCPHPSQEIHTRNPTFIEYQSCGYLIVRHLRDSNIYWPMYSR